MHHRSKYSPSRQGKAKLKPGPRKNTPMMTRTAQNIRNNVINEMANLRSSGLLLGFRSVYGARISPKSPTPGMVTPATIGWNMVSSSCRPRKYHGAFDGFGVRLKLAVASSGALTKAEKTSRKNVIARDATNSTTSKWGQTFTLSVGTALTSWIDPALTTVSSRWVCPDGPASPGPDGAPVTRAAAAAAPPPVAGAVAVAVAVPPPPPPASAPPPPAAFSRAAWLRASKWAGILPVFSASALEAATSSALGPPAAGA